MTTSEIMHYLAERERTARRRVRLVLAVRLLDVAQHGLYPAALVWVMLAFQL